MGYLQKRLFLILRDRILKHIQRWDLTKAVNSKYKFFVPSFAKAKTIRMNVKSCFCESNPEHIIIQVGTNDQYVR